MCATDTKLLSAANLTPFACNVGNVEGFANFVNVVPDTLYT